MMIKTIALSKLVPSSRNVRGHTDEQADLELKADIEARGLLQNLVVAKARRPRGKFSVEAGGRRLRAMQALVEEGKLDADHEVACLVIGGGAAAAREASLAENFQRLAMNPADECLAFQRLIDDGADVDGIARRFGLTRRFVEGRLRLASLAPVLFEALGAGEIGLDIARAYAATSDQERQAWVYEQLRGTYAAGHPDSIRRLMTEATANATDRRARLVGEEAYVAAGGRIERDLFCEEMGERWLDVALLERLAMEKMETLAAELAAEAGLAWVRPTLDSWAGYQLTEGLHRLVPEREPLSDEEQARAEAAQAEIDDLIGLVEDEQTSDEAREEAEAKIRTLEQEIETLCDKPPLIEETLKGKLGTFLLLDPEGRARLDCVFYSEAPIGPDGEEASDGQGARLASPASTPEETEASPKPLPRALVDELAMQRRDILAVHVAADPSLALDLATFLMVDRSLVYSSGRSGSSLLAIPPSNPVFGFETPEAAATLARSRRADGLNRSWIRGATMEERFDAFRALPDAARAAWLGHVIAGTLEASAGGRSERACPFHDHLGRLLGIDVASWWRPTGANFFDRVPKAVTLSALEEIGGPAFAARYAKEKKAALCEAAQRICAGELIAEKVKARALAWLPEAMRFGPEPAHATADDTPPWGEQSLPSQSDAVEPGSEEGDPQPDDDPAFEQVEQAA